VGAQKKYVLHYYGVGHTRRKWVSFRACHTIYYCIIGCVIGTKRITFTFKEGDDIIRILVVFQYST